MAEAATSESAVRAALATTPHVVVIDPIMRDGHGLVALSQIAESLPQTAVIALTAYADTALQMELHHLGVACILDKGIESQQLIQTIRERAHNGYNHRGE